MKIRIIKADKTKWYADKIGKVYVVKEVYKSYGGTLFFVIRNYRTILRMISVNDAEIVEMTTYTELYNEFKILLQAIRERVVWWLKKLRWKSI